MADFTPWSMADTWELLTVIQAFDDRNFQDAHAMSWNAMANQGRWPHDLAVAAVRQHFLNSRETLLPAHVHEYVRTEKQDQAMRDYERPSEGREITGNVYEFIENNWPSNAELELARLEIACPFEGCRVPATQPCLMGGSMSGRRKRHQPHPGRHYALAEQARAQGLDPSWDGPPCPTCGAPEGLRCMNLGGGNYLSKRTNPHPLRRGEAA